jgi:DNA-binding response OmpR family regulator
MTSVSSTSLLPSEKVNHDQSQKSTVLKNAQSFDRVLVVEDEAEIRELIVLHLMREGLKVDAVASAEEALELLTQNKYVLIALDWMLPGQTGVELTKALRLQKSDVSILMVTAKAESLHIVEGLEAGADDYLTKPFEIGILLARVRALIRRSQREVAHPQNKSKLLAQIQFGPLSMNSETFEVKSGEEVLALTPSEFKLLLTMAQNRGRVLTRDSLIEHVQGEGVSVVGRTVDTHIFGLRKKLGTASEMIETVRGIGYRIKMDD